MKGLEAGMRSGGESPARRAAGAAGLTPRDATAAVVAAGGLGLSANYLLWLDPLGPGLAVWIALLGASAVMLVRRHDGSWSGPVASWSVIAAAAAAGTGWRAAEELQVLFFLVLIVAASVVVLEARGRRFGRTRVADHLHGLALVPGLAALGGLPLLLRAELPAGADRGRTLGLARGLLLATPPLIVFGALFSAADPAFQRYVSRLTVLGEDFPAHAALTLGFGWIAAGLLRGALPGSRRNPLDRLRPPRVGVEEIAVVLGLVATLFTAFVILQLGYLFGGRAVIESVSGLTLAEYARRGFFELVAASALALVLLLVGGAAAPRDVGRWVYRSLSLVLVGLVLVVIASALLRLRLYIAEFGLTTDRLYATAFIVWLAATFGWFALTVGRGRPRRFASGALAAGIASVFLLGAANPAALVARTNLERDATRPVDTGYLLALGADAVPAVLDELDALPAAEQCRVAAHVRSRWGSPSRAATAEADHGGDWRNWNAGEARARSVTADLAPRLAALAAPCDSDRVDARP